MFTISTNGIYFGHWGWITEVIAAVMIAAGLWKIFVKAGDKGWKGVIPFYNSYIVFKLVWKVKFFFAEMLMLSAAVILDFWEPYSAQFFVIVLFIAVFVIGVIQKSKLSHALGHGGGYTLGLIVLEPVFMMILGFGSSSYNTPEGCPRAPLKKAANMILVILLCLLLTAAAVTAVYFRDPLTEGAATDKVSSHMTMHMDGSGTHRTSACRDGVTYTLSYAPSSYYSRGGTTYLTETMTWSREKMPLLPTDDLAAVSVDGDFMYDNSVKGNVFDIYYYSSRDGSGTRRIVRTEDHTAGIGSTVYMRVPLIKRIDGRTYYACGGRMKVHWIANTFEEKDKKAVASFLYYHGAIEYEGWQ